MQAFVVAPSADHVIPSERPVPAPSGRDLLVRVQASSVNPVDLKVRANFVGRPTGWDAAGVVVAVGPDVERFSVGDRVYYAGAITRDGCHSEQHLVDERIVGRAPAKLSDVEAAVVPLVALTAWEALFDRLEAKAGQSILIINGAGGVGSMAIQLAQRAGLTVITTASRDESRAWVKELGAHHVVDHRERLVEQVRGLGFQNVDLCLCCHDVAPHFEAMAELVAPEGSIACIVATDTLPMGRLFGKSVRFSWELMFTRSSSGRAPERQGAVLDAVAERLDAGTLRSPLRERLPMDAEGINTAHRRLASGHVIGKIGLVV